MKSQWRLLHAVPHKGKAGNATGAGKESYKQDKGATRSPSFLQLLPCLLVCRQESAPRFALFFTLFLSPVSVSVLNPCKTKCKGENPFCWHLKCRKRSISGNGKLMCCHCLMENVKAEKLVKNPSHIFSLKH